MHSSVDLLHVQGLMDNCGKEADRLHDKFHDGLMSDSLSEEADLRFHLVRAFGKVLPGVDHVHVARDVRGKGGDYPRSPKVEGVGVQR